MMARAAATLALSLALLGGCAKSHTVDGLPGGSLSLPENGAAGAAAAAPVDCDQQIEESLDGLPDDIACTGLYSDLAKKKVAEGVREYAPAHPLWSDGAGKRRWVWLPEGEKIDASKPKDWVFPVGTTFYKEFSANGKRVETRLYRKSRSDRWDKATYKWNSKETGATRSQGEDLITVGLGGNPYHIPTGRECDLCHNGRQDRILGFEAVSLGLAGAEGITLQSLVEDDLIEPAPKDMHYEIGNDSTGLAPDALGWFHINCGASCHNDNTDSEAYSSGLRLELDPADLDGRPATQLDVVKTTVNVQARTLRWSSETRITPGSPETSLLFRLISVRGGGKNDQMPPVATKIVDPEMINLIEDWIRGMPAGQTPVMGVE